MANEQNLIPIQSTSRARELGRKGGKVKSAKKTFANRLSALKKKGMTNESAKRITEIFENPELSALDIWLFLERAKSECKTAGQMAIVADKFISLHKAHHGEKIKSENTNININIDALKFQELAKKYSEDG